MIYQAVDYMHLAARPLAATLNFANEIIKSDANPLVNTRLRRLQSAMLETGARLFQDYPKQEWGFESVKINDKEYPVDSETVIAKPFCDLLKFRRRRLKKSAPKVLFVAALSGHHATLSRRTFEAFLPDHEIYITDWRDARYVPLSDGPFGLDEYVDYLIEFIRELGPDVHVVSLCQAGVPSLIAAAIMSAGGDKILPRSLSILAAPIDMRINPGPITKLSEYTSLRAWKMYALHRVPSRYPGAGRKVYPGILQLGGFMSMNFGSHLGSHKQFMLDAYHENEKAKNKHREFYDEYFSILDMTEEFCVQTLERIFLNHQLARNQYEHRGQLADLTAITDIPLLSIEGKEDEFVRPGQCTVANDLCTGLPETMKETYVQPGAGHYGVFNSKKYRKKVAPKIMEFIAAHN